MSSLRGTGHPYQSIYAWRDANPSLFQHKIEEWHDERNKQLELTHSRRCGPEICRFLNLLHKERSLESANTQTISEVKVIYYQTGEPFTEIIEKYKDQIETQFPDKNNRKIAILCRSNRLVSELRGIKVLCRPEKCFPVKFENESSLPLKCQLEMLEHNYGKAFQIAQKYLYFLISKKFLLGPLDLNDHPVNLKENVSIIWSFCTALPSIDLPLDVWVDNINALSNDTLSKLGFIPDFQISPKRRYHTEKVSDILNYNQNTDSVHVEGLVIETIHSSKGKSYDAVLVMLDEQKITTKNLVAMINRDKFFTGSNNEEDRCFYVAASRAKNLLWVAIPNVKNTEIFPGFNSQNICSNVVSTLQLKLAY